MFIHLHLDLPHNNTGLECPAWGPLVSPGRGEFPDFGHYASANTFEEDGWYNHREVGTNPTLGLFYGYLKKVYQTTSEN